MPRGIAKSPTIINKVLTQQDTEYPVDLPAGVTRLRLRARASECKLSFEEDQVAAPSPTYQTISSQPAYEVEDIAGVVKIYLASATAGAVVEITCWR